MLILYAATAGESVVKLYAGAFVPGFVLAGLYIVYVVGRVMIDPKLAPALPEDRGSMPRLQVFGALLTSFFPLAILILSVLGAIIFGLRNSDGGGRRGRLRQPRARCRLSGAGFSAAQGGGLSNRTHDRDGDLYSWAPGRSLRCSHISAGRSLLNLIKGMNMNRVEFLLLSQFIIFLLGWPLEWTEIIIIFVPIFLPLLKYFDVNPIVFGILVALNIQTSFNTPPMAMAAYYLKGVAPPQVRLTQIFGGALPFVFMVFITMGLLYAYPQLALWLPDRLYSGR